MVNRVLITGVSGLLGGYLYRTISQECDNVFGTWCSTAVYPHASKRLDVTDKDEVFRVISQLRPDVIIHCAALGDVDYCERNRVFARRVNVAGVAHVADAARQVGAKMVYISSNAVYDGTRAPYTEDARHSTVNVYGYLKMLAEICVTDSLDESQYMIVRPIMLYGWPTHSLNRGNWATKLKLWLEAGKTIHMVDDVLTQPTYAHDCARAIWTLAKTGQVGAWNIGGMDRISLYQMAHIVAEVWGIEVPVGQIVAVNSDHFKTIAPRPKDTTYDMTKLYDYADSLGLSSMKSDLTPRGVARGLAAMKEECSELSFRF